MVLTYKKLGYIISLIAIVVQIPMMLLAIFKEHNLVGIPGLFINLSIILTITIIYLAQRTLEKEQRRLSNLFRQTAIALVNAIDAKDKYTHGHSSRVADYSRKLAEMNGKSAKECDEVYYAALLHDVGKIGIPVSIINKDGKLTREEYEVIKQHPAMGAQILEHISEFPFLSIGAHYHHERFDGKGYPKGLSGTEIPELARIISVADAYDAMTSRRSYRDLIPQQRVREEIVKGSGTQFDPVYARLMIHLIDDDVDYMLKERAAPSEREGAGGDEGLIIGTYRSAFTEGILISSNLTSITLEMAELDQNNSVQPELSMILFDSLDGNVHTDEKRGKELLYLEYGEIWLNGRNQIGEARKIQTNNPDPAVSDIDRENVYRIEAVRIKDHALIKVYGKDYVQEVTVALPDSTRYMYISLTGMFCRIRNLEVTRSEEEYPADFIPRIAEEISYINVPEGDIPNVQVDGFRSSHSEGILIRDGLQITFHARSLPTARLVWHCPFIDIFCSDDGKVGGEGYRDLAFLRLDGEFCECDSACNVKPQTVQMPDFGGWDSWKDFNKRGFDATVTFEVEGNTIFVITENGGISTRGKATLTGIDRPIYAAVTGDQCAITNIRIW
ncbi:MAG: HD-GYP domain-containing protein [Lachnospiraceae bacterium]|nr:HD-GYP domain-containing protein [Lachnospiraceae bacterium]